MKRDIRVLIIDTCGWITAISVVVFFFTLWLFSYNQLEDPLKESWSITFAALSALATIGAAIIASSLFNDWKDQHNKTILSPEAITTYKKINKDIMKNAKYIHIVRKNINRPLKSDQGLKILKEFGKLLDTKSERIIDLKYFSTLADNEEINTLIYSYNSCLNNHLLYLDSLSSDSSTQLIDQNFLDMNDRFIKDSSQIQLDINKKLKDYILFK